MPSVKWNFKLINSVCVKMMLFSIILLENIVEYRLFLFFFSITLYPVYS